MNQRAVSTAEYAQCKSTPTHVTVPFWETLSEDARVYNFAYGANVSRDSVERRKLQPLESVPCRLPGFRLTFRLPALPLVEPSMGDVEVVDDDDDELHEIHGVCHLLTRDAWRRLQKSEGGQGVDRRQYVPHKVKCIAYDGRELEAYVLMTEQGKCIAPPLGFWCPPSARYVGKIVGGHKDYGMSSRYTDAVSQLPVTRAGFLAKAYVATIAVLMSPFLLVGFAHFRLAGGSLTSNPVIRGVVLIAWCCTYPFIPRAQCLARPVSLSVKPAHT
jgi:hypothetical protein